MFFFCYCIRNGSDTHRVHMSLSGSNNLKLVWRFFWTTAFQNWLRYWPWPGLRHIKSQLRHKWIKGLLSYRYFLLLMSMVTDKGWSVLMVSLWAISMEKWTIRGMNSNCVFSSVDTETCCFHGNMSGRSKMNIQSLDLKLRCFVLALHCLKPKLKTKPVTPVKRCSLTCLITDFYLPL